MSYCKMCGEEIKKSITVVDIDGERYGMELCLKHSHEVYGKMLALPNHSKIPYK